MKNDKIRNCYRKTSDGGFGAYAPDLPGWIDMGATKEEVLQNMAGSYSISLARFKRGRYASASESEVENLVFVS